MVFCSNEQAKRLRLDYVEGRGFYNKLGKKE
jgi:hypothetical protein